MNGVLVVGYGNSLRGDDGVGWHAAARLADDPRMAGAEVLARQQLVPELAEDVSRASLVVLIDARHGGAPGTVTVQRVQPQPAATVAWSHQLQPPALVELAGGLYGAAPPVFLVGVGPATLAEGDRLSPVLERALPRVVEAVVRVVEDHHRA